MIFVFGSNREGRHGKGAALEARLNHGAIYGQTYGRQGDSFAIVTKELRPYRPKVTLSEVAFGVRGFLEYARAHPELQFQVSPIGCGLAGFRPEEISPLFASHPDNVFLPEPFLSALESL